MVEIVGLNNKWLKNHAIAGKSSLYYNLIKRIKE